MGDLSEIMGHWSGSMVEKVGLWVSEVGLWGKN